jgi:S1-C subfamily serine protease
VTNAHVANGTEKIRVTTLSGEVIHFETIMDGFNEVTDISLLRVKVPTSELAQRALKLAREGTIRLGDHVVVLGNPTGLKGIVSDG